jgi:hypothetical protein
MGVNIIARLLGLDDDIKEPENNDRVKGYYKIRRTVVEKEDQDDEVVEDESE